MKRIVVHLLVGFSVACARLCHAGAADDYLIHLVLPGNRFYSFVSEDKMPGKGCAETDKPDEERKLRMEKWREYVLAGNQLAAEYVFDTWTYSNSFTMVAENAEIKTSKCDFNHLIGYYHEGDSLKDDHEHANGDREDNLVNNFKIASGPADNSFEVRWLCPGGKFSLDRRQCVRDLWLTSWNDIEARWNRALDRSDYDGVRREMRDIIESGRCDSDIPGGNAWKRHIDEFRKEIEEKSVIKVENKSDRPVWFKLGDSGFMRMDKASARRYDVRRSMIVNKEGHREISVEWTVLPADESPYGEALCTNDFQIADENTGTEIWATGEKEYAVIVENHNLEKLKYKDPPRVHIPEAILPAGAAESMPMFEIRYAGASTNEPVRLVHYNKASFRFEFGIKAHVRVESVTVKYPGYIAKTFKAPEAFRMCYGDETRQVTEASATGMERVPWPAVSVSAMKSNTYMAPFNLQLVVEMGEDGGNRQVARALREGIVDASFDLQNGRDFKLGELDMTNVWVTVRAWSRGANEDTENTASVVRRNVIRGSDAVKIEVELHEYVPLPCDFGMLLAMGEYINKSLGYFVGGSDGSPARLESLDKIRRGSNPKGTDEYDFDQAVESLVEHIERNRKSGHADCIPSCECRKMDGGVSYAEEYDRVDGEEGKRLAILAVATRKAAQDVWKRTHEQPHPPENFGYGKSVDDLIRKIKDPEL